MDITVTPVDVSDADFAGLVAALDAYQLPLYPAQSNHLISLAELKSADARAWLARVNAVFSPDIHPGKCTYVWCCGIHH